MSSVWPGAAKLPVILGVVGAVNPIGVLGTDAGAGSKGTSSSILAPVVVKNDQIKILLGLDCTFANIKNIS